MFQTLETKITLFQSVRALKETSWSSRSGLNPTRTTPPCYNNTTLGNRLSQCKGPNVTNPICVTCKNCSHKCAADCEHCHTIQHDDLQISFLVSTYGFTISGSRSSIQGQGHTNTLNAYTWVDCVIQLKCNLVQMIVWTRIPNGRRSVVKYGG